MKKLLLILSFVLISLVSFGQVQNKSNYILNDRGQYFVPDYNTTPQINITLNQVDDGNGWAQMGVPCAGCPSYFFKIQRSVSSFKAKDGNLYYYFFFYFFSNSYYANGNSASTYLKDVNFYSDQNWVFKTDYLLLNVGVPIYGAWMRSPDPNTTVQFTVTQMSVY